MQEETMMYYDIVSKIILAKAKFCFGSSVMPDACCCIACCPDTGGTALL